MDNTHPNKALGIRTAGPSIDLGSTPYLLVLTKNQWFCL